MITMPAILHDHAPLCTFLPAQIASGEMPEQR
jgi:hypothetical protein